MTTDTLNSSRYNIYVSKLIFVNTDPQRRCYNGCHFSGEYQRTDWELLESRIPEDEINQRLQFWTELNDYAVSQRGKSAKKEFKKVLSNEVISQIP
jgi:hypothetical protein